MKNSKNAKSPLFFYSVFAVVIALVLILIQPFINAILLSLVVAMMFSPLYRFFYKKVKQRKGWAEVLTVFTISIIFIVPIFILGTLATKQLNELSREFTDIVRENEVTIEKATQLLNDGLVNIPGIEPVTEKEAEQYIDQGFDSFTENFFDQVLSLGASSVEITVQVTVFIFLLLVIIPKMDEIKSFILDLSPLDDQIDRLYIEKVSKMVSSTIKGTFVIAVVQTIASVIFLYFAGLGYLLLLSIILLFVAVIPFVGTAVVVVPIGIFMIVSGDVEWGVFLIITNLLVVSSVDNVLKPFIVSGDTSINSALILLSILGGLRLFGPFGFIFGPVIMIFALTTIDIYKKYYR